MTFVLLRLLNCHGRTGETAEKRLWRAEGLSLRLTPVSWRLYKPGMDDGLANLRITGQQALE
jgi:hypothetical protein